MHVFPLSTDMMVDVANVSDCLIETGVIEFLQHELRVRPWAILILLNNNNNNIMTDVCDAVTEWPVLTCVMQ